jgi:hypothetical protein
MDKGAFQDPRSVGDRDTSPTYGEYFSAAQAFLQQDDMARLRDAVGQMLHKTIASQDVDRIGIYLVKHGAFYHPARIDVSVFNRIVALVLNVAISSRGRRQLPIEFGAVSRLTHELSRSYWPQFYGHGNADTGVGRQWPMILGAWLEGFYEFHLAEDSASQHLHVVVWDSDRGHKRLKDHQMLELISQAAEILTYAYHPLTYEAILDWHHAAGDFVVRFGRSGIELRLITVRNYAPLVADTDADVSAVLDAMVAFLVSISLRLRLDRIEGIGRLAGYPVSVVPAIWEGFCRGLQAAVAERGLPADFGDAIIDFIRLQGVERLTSFTKTLIEKYPPDSEARDLLDQMVNSHLEALWAAISA